MSSRNIEEVMKLDEKYRNRARDVLPRSDVLTALDEIEASDDPKAKIAEIRKRLSL